MLIIIKCLFKHFVCIHFLTANTWFFCRSYKVIVLKDVDLSAKEIVREMTAVIITAAAQGSYSDASFIGA